MTARALALIRTKQVSRTDLAQGKNIKRERRILQWLQHCNINIAHFLPCVYVSEGYASIELYITSIESYI